MFCTRQAFTVVTVFNAMTFALKVTPFSVKSLSEASVAMERFKVGFFSLLLEMTKHYACVHACLHDFTPSYRVCS